MKTSKRIIALILLIAFVIFMPILYRSCMKDGDVSIQDGAALAQQGKFAEAALFFETALEQECSYSKDTIYIMIANCHSQLKDYEKAIEWRNKALEFAPDAENYVGTALLYRILKDDETAREYYLKALELEPQSVSANASLGALYISQNKIEEALELLEKARELEPGSGIIHADIAICHARLGNFQKAEEEYAEASKLKTQGIEQFRSEIDQLKQNAAQPDGE